MRPLEAKIETNFVNKLKRWSLEQNLEIICWKISPLGIRGLPDRIIMWPGRGIVFVEFKRPGEVARKLQEYIHYQLIKLGFDVEVHDDANVAVESIQARIRASLATTSCHENDGQRRWVQSVPQSGAGKDSSGS